MKLLGLALPLFALIAVACEGDAASTPVTDDVEQVIVSTATPVPTVSNSPPSPTSTPVAKLPSNTPVPTSTPLPLPPSPTADHLHPPDTAPHDHPAVTDAAVVVTDWDPAAIQAPAISTERFDLSELDASATEAKMIELVSEGWVLYGRLSIFSPRESLGIDPESLAAAATTAAEIARLPYPETLYLETWMELAPSGGSKSLNYEIKPDGTLLNYPVQLESGVSIVDMATGTVLDPTPVLSDANLNPPEVIAGQFLVIAANQQTFGEGVEGELFGRPSMAFGDDLEYQFANPFFFRQAMRQENPDGNVVLVTQIETVDFAILPPGSMPDVASWPPN